MKIEIRKQRNKACVLLDGKPVEGGCMGFEITSQGGNYAILTLKLAIKDLSLGADVDIISQEASAATPSPKRFGLNWPKR